MNTDIQNNKLLILGKLTASLAHEIRNPLSAIKLNLESVKLCNDNLDEDTEESIDASLTATERISSLIESTLAFSRKTNASLSLNNLNDVVNEGIDLLRAEAKKKNILLKKSLKKTLPLAEFNRNKILQVILNLATNAMQASNNGATVEIKTKSSSKGHVILEIVDEGSGIKAEDHDKIFTDFYTSKKTGTGLGLSVCKQLVDEQNGTISFKSKEDEGTVFKVTIPIKDTEGEDDS